MINQPVSMVVLIDESGVMQLIRFKLTAEDESEQVIKIEKFQLRKADNFTRGKRIFDCIVVINGLKRIAEIHYDLLTCKWTLVNLK